MALIGMCIGAGLLVFIIATIVLSFLGIKNPIITGSITVIILVLVLGWLNGKTTIIAKDVSEENILYELKISPNSKKIKIKKIKLNSDGTRPDDTFKGVISSFFSSDIERCTFEPVNQGLIRQSQTTVYACWYELELYGGKYDGKILRYGIIDEVKPRIKPVKENEISKISAFTGEFDETFFGKLKSSDFYLLIK